MKQKKKQLYLLVKLSESLPQLEGNIAVKGLKKEVRILRDEWGIPHIKNSNNVTIRM